MKGCSSAVVTMALSLETTPSCSNSSSSSVFAVSRGLSKRTPLLLRQNGFNKLQVLHSSSGCSSRNVLLASAFPPFPAFPESASEATDSDTERVPAREKTPEEMQEAEESVQQILRVLELLRANRDMTPNEVRLTVMIEDPRMVEYEESWIPKDDMAAALQDIIDGKIPDDMDALRALRDELLAWPNLEEMIEKKDPRQSPYAQITDTGVDPVVSAERANIEWDTAAEFTAGKQKELGDTLPPVVGYSFLYLLTFVPIIIGVAVVAILYVNSFQ